MEFFCDSKINRHKYSSESGMDLFFYLCGARNHSVSFSNILFRWFEIAKELKNFSLFWFLSDCRLGIFSSRYVFVVLNRCADCLETFKFNLIQMTITNRARSEHIIAYTINKYFRCVSSFHWLQTHSNNAEYQIFLFNSSFFCCFYLLRVCFFFSFFISFSTQFSVCLN